MPGRAVRFVATLMATRFPTGFLFPSLPLRSFHRKWGSTRVAVPSGPRCEMSTSHATHTGTMDMKKVVMDYSTLEGLASRVVRGLTREVAPAGSLLRRRRSWHLFLEAKGRVDAAILVVDKKSTFTLDDARTAIAIFNDETSARRRNPSGDGARQLLVATRASVTPAADAFFQGLRAKSLDDGPQHFLGISRWEEIQGMLEGGSHRGLFPSWTPHAGGGNPGDNGKSFALPRWLVEERRRARSTEQGRLFDLQAPFEPSGDQPEAIEALIRGVAAGKRHQTLLGATGTGKTFIIANVIERVALPTLVLAPNKVLAAQLTNELRALFPNNAVEYFVSYYDYYMPEAFNAASDTYIDKVVVVNDDIDRMRHSATRSLLERRDVIVVASVSCIYGLGMPSKYLEATLRIEVGQAWPGGWGSLAQHLEKQLLYEAHQDERGFEASPRGKVRRVSSEGGWGLVELGPVADEAIVRVSVDATGVISRIYVASIKGAPSPEEDDFDQAQQLSTVLAGSGIEGITGAKVQMTPSTNFPLGDGDDGVGEDVEALVIYPAKHHVVSGGEMENVLRDIATEMEERCAELGSGGRWLEAERLRQRTENDMLLLRSVGTCKGVENYSRHLSRRRAGDPPATLVDYFPEDDWLLVVDESHVSAPQLGAMWAGDRARKLKLVEHGFRLPSALDNRPLKADEFWSKVDRNIFLSATPGKFELELSSPGGQHHHPWPEPGATQEEEGVSDAERSAPILLPGGASEWTTRGLSSDLRDENKSHGSPGSGWDGIGSLVDAQAVIRPTGITDPPVDIRPSRGQVADMVQECKLRKKRGERVLVTVLTKRMAEDLCAFLAEQGVRSAYLHSEVKPMQRLELLQLLRRGDVDVIVGVNLLREGLNLPEVSLVCILDADAEGFLRSDTALLQTIGRATRHEAGRVVLYADRVTPSMKRALAETDRRRDIQLRHNQVHGITPSVAKAAAVGDSLLEGVNGVFKDGGGAFQGRRGDDPEDLVSWTGATLPPDQVQVLYDLAARNGEGGTPGRRDPASASMSGPSFPVDTSPVPPDVARGIASDLSPGEGTIRALKRLTEQAAEKMALASSRTDFKEAALWRDRRNALLAAMQTLEKEVSRITTIESDEDDTASASLGGGL